ncbi:MAG: hypothetical protein GAK30_02659 [Paracidovorax wautersii]|uniref:Tripartite tricarboxylate transporter family receptor n=1 Tax=Paracidovorax wautersii TaxID=1177982 RepID=A0A7V8FMQ2_9BURK|nr:MAG: hypothetical protein GAK30_02659 [Paracidovorax wautersii]
MGIETPISLLGAVLQGRASGSNRPIQCAVLAGRATADIPAGTRLAMGGHHHDVTGVQAVLLLREQAPAGVPPAIVDKLAAALQQALQAPDVRQRISSVGGEIFPGGRAEMADFIAQQTQRMGQVVRDGNIRPE